VKCNHNNPDNRGRCRTCHNTRQNRRRAKNPQKHRSYANNYRIINPEKVKGWVNNKRFGLGEKLHYDSQMKKQKELCAICKKSMKSPCRDHDHACCPPKVRKSGRGIYRVCCGRCRRGLLCRGCNSILGRIEWTIVLNPEMKIDLKNSWLVKAHKYVWKWKRIQKKVGE
jgi:hypothetical protein